MSKVHLVSGLVVGAGIILGAGAGAKAATNVEIVVTAARERRDVSDVPANVSVITAEDLRRAGSATLVEALDRQAGITMRSTAGNPATTEIGMRGFGENAHGRVLVLLDGQRVNRPDMAPVDWLQFPVSSIERVEIVRGANTSLYGDHALAGVINIITRKGRQAPRFDASVEGGSFGLNSERLALAASGDRVSASAAGERVSADGYRERSAYRSYGGSLGFTWDPTDRLNSSLALSWQDSAYQMPGYLSKEQMKENPRQAVNQADEAENRVLNAGLDLTALVGDAQRAEVRLGYSRKDIASDMVSWSSASDWLIDTLSLSPKYVCADDLFGRQNNFIVGVDYGVDRLDLKRYATVARAGVRAKAEVNRRTLGAYVLNEFEFADAATFGVGGRTERATLSARIDAPDAAAIDDRKTQNEQAFDLSLIKRFADRSKAFAKAGTVYRYPFVDEQVSYQGFGDAFYKDINPERGWSADVGTDVQISPDFRVGLTAFLLQLRNEIAYNMATFRNENMDRTRRMGAEAEMTWTPVSRLRLEGNYSYTDATFTDGPNDGNEVPLVPRHKATLSGRVALPLNLAFTASATYVGESRLGGDVANAAGTLDGYTVTDMVLRFTPKRPNGLAVHVAADNVFDERYAAYGYSGMGFGQDAYYPSPSRAFRGGVSYRF